MKRRGTRQLSSADVTVSTGVMQELIADALAAVTTSGALRGEIEEYLQLPDVSRSPKPARRITLNEFAAMGRDDQRKVSARAMGASAQEQIDGLLRQLLEPGADPRVVFKLDRVGRARPRKNAKGRLGGVARDRAIAAEIMRVSTEFNRRFGPRVLDADVRDAVAEAFGLSTETVGRAWRRFAESEAEWAEAAPRYLRALKAAGLLSAH